jgi:hypothetical protein
MQLIWWIMSPPYSEKRREQQRQEAKENGLPFMEKGEMNDGKN